MGSDVTYQLAGHALLKKVVRLTPSSPKVSYDVANGILREMQPTLGGKREGGRGINLDRQDQTVGINDSP